jgi:hypothetical protein
VSEHNNVERWDGLRLWVYRTSSGGMPCAVIMRYSRGGRQDDVLLGRHEVPTALREQALADPYYALLAAILQLRGAVFVQNELAHMLRAQPTPSPRGDHGGTIPLDIPGNI